jgi:MFS family permease
MAIVKQESGESGQLQPPATNQPRLGWGQILAISIFAFALIFHWSALNIIVVPSQVLEIVGDAHKGTALAFVLVPGAFVALFSNPLFGWLSDRLSGRLASWGRRRPYIFIGTLVNIGALIWMASSRDIVSLTLAYILTQFASNAAQAPFHALLPDIVPAEQRGLASGVMGLLQITGNVGGLIVAALFIDTSKSFAAYLGGQWMVYVIIIAVMLVLMLVTIFSVRDHEPSAAPAAGPGERSDSDSDSDEERAETLPGDARREAEAGEARPRPFWRAPAALTIAGTLVAILLAWGLMTLWNMGQRTGMQIDSNTQQVVLEVIATIGILRLFDFNPRRDPDFAWVLVTRLILMLGIYSIQDFLFYYMRDAVGASNPSSATTLFGIVVSLTSLVTAFAAGWLSDRFGRKRMVYISGFLMALVGGLFVITHSLPIVLASGALFGLGYGAYQSVDWALVVDVLPSQKHFARDMGIWNIAVSIAQVIAPVFGGPIIDSFTQAGHPVQGFQVLFTLAIVYCIAGTVTVRFIRSVKS